MTDPLEQTLVLSQSSGYYNTMPDPPEQTSVLSQSSYNTYELDEWDSVPSEPPSADQLQRLKERLITIPSNEIYISETLLGKGAFGSVFEGTYNGSPVAVKEFNPIPELGFNSLETLQAFEWETNRWEALHHPNLVQFYGACQNQAGSLCTVMELCKGQDLSKRLRQAVEVASEPKNPYSTINLPQQQVKSRKSSKGSPPLGWDTLWRIALDLAHGLAYLHEQGVLHRDLKSENVLLDMNGRAKLADLGVAQVDALIQGDEPKILSCNLKDYGYAAPEEFQAFATAKSDMFSYGLVLCEMLQGRILGDRQNRQDGKLEVIPLTCPMLFSAIIERCWATDPSQRPSAREVIQLLEGCKADPVFNIPEADSLLPRLEMELGRQQEALRRYVPSRISDLETIHDGIQLFLTDDKTQVLAVLGEGGLGKTLCTYFLANELLRSRRNQAQSSASGVSTAVKTWLPIFLRPAIAQWQHKSLLDGIRTALGSSTYGLSSEAIQRLHTQTSERLLFILDGYDELSGDAVGNLAATLGLSEWPSAKLIISSRPTVASREQLPNLFGVSGICTIYTLLPFNHSELLRFLGQNLNWDEAQAQKFESKLLQAPELAHAVMNPFVSHLFVQSWNTQQTEDLATLTTHAIYANFIRHWIITYAPLLPTPVQLSLWNQSEATLFDPRVAIQSAQGWLNQTAFTMAKQETLSLPQTEIFGPWTQIPDALKVYASNIFRARRQKSDTLVRGIASTNDSAQKMILTKELEALQRRAILSLPQYQTLLLGRARGFLDNAPLKCRNVEYQFIHKSLWEYSVAQGIHHALSSPLDHAARVLASGLSPSFILQDPSVLKFLQGITKVQDLDHWEKWLHLSKENPNVAPVAASAITALNGLQRLLPRDLRGIRVRGADLRNAWLSGSDCREADFTEVLLNGSCLIGTQFQDATLKDIQLGEFPTQNFDNTVEGLAYHPTESLIAVAVDGNVILRNPYTHTVLHTLHRGGSVRTLAFSSDGHTLASGTSDSNIFLWLGPNPPTLGTTNWHRASHSTRTCFLRYHCLLQAGRESPGLGRLRRDCASLGSSRTHLYAHITLPLSNSINRVLFFRATLGGFWTWFPGVQANPTQAPQ